MNYFETVRIRFADLVVGQTFKPCGSSGQRALDDCPLYVRTPPFDQGTRRRAVCARVDRRGQNVPQTWDFEDTDWVDAYPTGEPFSK